MAQSPTSVNAAGDRNNQKEYQSGADGGYGNIRTPEEWAVAQLQFMGLPTTQSNITFLVSWAAREGGNGPMWGTNNLAWYNPLNTTEPEPGYSETGTQGNIGSYKSWQQGIEATASTLRGYGQIMSALQSGDAMTANNNGSLASNFLTWSGNGYTQIGANTSYGSVSGTPGVQGSTAQSNGGAGTSEANAANANMPPAPGMNDIPALKAYIATYDPDFAWLLDEPGVADVLMQAVAKQDNTTQIQAAIQQTQWWQQTSQAVKNYEQELYQNPADYGPNAFNKPGSVANQTLAQVQAEAQQQGVTLTAEQQRQLAQNFMQYGWTAPQLQQAIGAYVFYNAKTSGPNGTGVQSDVVTNAAGLVQQLQTQAGNYLLNVSPGVLQSWAENIAAGTRSMQQFDGYLAGNASVKWAGMAPMIQQGQTPSQIVDQYRQDASNIMEVSPNSIDFVNNPIYSKILDYAPPPGKGQNPADVPRRMMTTSEMTQYLQSQPSWQYTSNARNAAANLAQTWGQMLGAT